MKIIDIKTTIVNAEMRNWVFVKVITDDDIYGWGEATVEWKTRSVVGAIEDIKPLLIGKDPRNIKQNFQIMTKHERKILSERIFGCGLSTIPYNWVNLR